MRTLFICFLVLAAALTKLCYASSHGANVSGTIYYQPNPASPVIATLPFTNPKIIKAVLFADGTSVAEIAKDVSKCDIAVDDTNYNMDVIVKDTGHILFPLGVSGTGTVILGPIEHATRTKLIESRVQSDYHIFVLAGEVVFSDLQVQTTLTGTNVDSIAGHFTGGTAQSEPLQGELIGAFTTTKKVYNPTP